MKRQADVVKKNRKKGIIGVCCFFLIIAAVILAFFYLGQNSEAKKQYEAQVQQETQQFTEELVAQLDQIDTSAVDETAGAAADAAVQPVEIPSGIKTEAEKQVIGDELNKLEDERKKQVLQTLAVAYSEALDEQKQEAFRMVEELVAQGKADWAALVKSGENTSANKVKMASEYIAKSKVLEEQMDASFQALTDKMESQMSAEGIDPTEIIAQYQAEYDKIKSENKSAMMKKVMDALKH